MSVRGISLSVLGLVWTMAAHASSPSASAPDGQGALCRGAIHQAEIGSGLPSHLLNAIGRVESGRANPTSGHIDPWPWTINAEGQGYFFDTKPQAIAFARQLQGRGIRSIDVGCLQVNLMYHPDAFQDLEEAFDPAANARYAVKFLAQLREKTGSWETASAWYHSANPQDGAPYREKVVTAMTDEAQRPASFATAGASVFAPPAWPMTVSTLRGMQAGHANIIMLPNAPYGAPRAAVLPQLATSADNSGPPLLQLAATSTAGRGLDSYRSRPVNVVKLRLLAAR